MIILLTFVFGAPATASAHIANYVCVTIDTSSNLFASTVITSDEWSQQSHPERTSTLISSKNAVTTRGGTVVKEDSKIKKDQSHLLKRGNALAPDLDKMPLTFPCGGEDMTPEDVRRSQLANVSLIPSLNSAIVFALGRTPNSVDELIETAEKLCETGNGKSVIIGEAHCSQGKNAKVDIDVKGKDLGAQYYVTITKGEKSKAFLCKLRKASSYANDVTPITWNHCVAEAMIHYYRGFTMDNATTVVEPGAIESGVTDLVSAINSGVSSILGLYSIDELVFIGGDRSVMYTHGIFRTDWEPALFTIFSIVYIVILGFFLVSIISLIVRYNLSAMSGSERYSFMKDVQTFIFAGLYLVIFIPCVGMVFNLTDLFTNIFTTLVPATTRGEFFARVAGQGSAIAGAIAGFVLLFVTITLNVTYVIRAILTCILIATGPYAIWTLTMGESMQQTFSHWLKVFFATVLIQPIHALVLGFLFCTPISGIRGIEGLVFCACLIAVSTAIGQIIFKEGASALQSATRSTTGVVSGGMAAAYIMKKASGITAPVKGVTKRARTVAAANARTAAHKSAATTAGEAATVAAGSAGGPATTRRMGAATGKGSRGGMTGSPEGVGINNKKSVGGNTSGTANPFRGNARNGGAGGSSNSRTVNSSFKSTSRPLKTNLDARSKRKLPGSKL